MLAVWIILAVLFILAVLRFGVMADYSKDEVSIKANIGPVKIDIFQTGENADSRKKQHKKKRKTKSGKKTAQKKEKIPEKDGKKGNMVGLVKEVLPYIITMLKRLKRRILINELTIHYTAASEDPFKAAMNYGYAWAELGAVSALFNNAFRVKKQNLSADVDFEGQKDSIYLKARISLALWEIIYIAAAVIPAVIKFVDVLKERTEKNGQTSDK